MFEVIKDQVKYRRVSYRNGVSIYFSEDLRKKFRVKFQHKTGTRQFPFVKNLLEFLRLNNSIELYFSELDEHKPFIINGNEYFVNVDSYIDFCKKIQTNTEGRAQAFFGQHIDHSALITPEQRNAILKTATTEDITTLLNSLNNDDKTQVLEILQDADLSKLDEISSEQLKLLLQTDEGVDLMKTLLSEGVITSSDITNVGYRKNQLSEFKSLLENQEYWKEYAQTQVDSRQTLDVTKEEKVWQHFFKKNPWIFGYGLDYQYLEILQEESTVRGADVSGKGEEKLDTLAGTSEYTVLVELKKPSTQLFDSSQSRSNSWRLSGELFLAVSQILEYKASHIIEWQDESKKFNAVGQKINQKSLDPKTILIIGSDTMFSGNEKEIEIKRKTFELFRRDSRNVKILTYDELYRRAEFIVERAAV